MRRADDFVRQLGREAGPCSVELLRELLDSLHSAAFIVDLNGRIIVWANAATRTVFGYEREELLGRSTRVLHVDEQAFAEFGARLDGALEAGTRLRHHGWVRRSDGTVFASEHLVTRVREIGGRRLVISLVTDLSDYMERQFDLASRHLSPREHEVFQLTIRGLTTQEVAERLGVSHRTVEVHRAHVLKKFDVSSTAKLMADMLAAAVVRRSQL